MNGRAYTTFVLLAAVAAVALVAGCASYPTKFGVLHGGHIARDIPLQANPGQHDLILHQLDRTVDHRSDVQICKGWPFTSGKIQKVFHNFTRSVRLIEDIKDELIRFGVREIGIFF